MELLIRVEQKNPKSSSERMRLTLEVGQELARELEREREDALIFAVASRNWWQGPGLSSGIPPVTSAGVEKLAASSSMWWPIASTREDVRALALAEGRKLQREKLIAGIKQGKYLTAVAREVLSTSSSPPKGQPGDGWNPWPTMAAIGGFSLSILARMAPGSFDAEIARHSIMRGHWPGRTPEQVQRLISEVRNGAQAQHTASNGQRIYRRGDNILIENPARGEGTLFQPSRSSTEYFRDWVRNNP